MQHALRTTQTIKRRIFLPVKSCERTRSFTPAEESPLEQRNKERGGKREIGEAVLSTHNNAFLKTRVKVKILIETIMITIIIVMITFCLPVHRSHQRK
jgi:hypothetical protein